MKTLHLSQACPHGPLDGLDFLVPLWEDWHLSFILWAQWGRSHSCTSVWQSFRWKQSRELVNLLEFQWLTCDWGRLPVRSCLVREGCSGSLSLRSELCVCDIVQEQRARHLRCLAQGGPSALRGSCREGFHNLLMRFPLPCFILWPVYAVSRNNKYTWALWLNEHQTMVWTFAFLLPPSPIWTAFLFQEPVVWF